MAATSCPTVGNDPRKGKSTDATAYSCGTSGTDRWVGGRRRGSQQLPHVGRRDEWGMDRQSAGRPQRHVRHGQAGEGSTAAAAASTGAAGAKRKMGESLTRWFTARVRPAPG